MKNLTKKLLDGFSNKNLREVWSFDENVDPEFYKLIFELHDGTLPKDFIFSMVRSALMSIGEALEYNEVERLEEDRAEYVDSMVPIYTHEIIDHYTHWPEYADAAKVDNLPPDSTIQDCMAMGVWLHCDEILGQVLDFIKENSHD